MDFGLSEDQELLQRSARDFLERECPPELVRKFYGTADGHPPELHQKMAELGWTGLLIPEAYGGLGLGMLDMALVLEEMGRVAAPGAFLFSSLLAALALVQAGTETQKERWLPRLANGAGIGTVAIVEGDERWEGEGVTLRARKAADGYVISGSKMFVPFAAVADVLITAVRTEGPGGSGISLLLVERGSPGITLVPLEMFDQTRRVYEVTFDDVLVPHGALLGAEGGGWEVVSRIIDAACIGLAADGLGGSERALEMAVAYTKTRTQFNRPVASFQALKHMAAEMASDIEPSRSLVWYAAYAFDNESARCASRAAAMAKAHLSDVYARTANRAVQMHGGIGFTWEHDIHFWLKRAKWNDVAFGDPAFHRERVISLEEV